MINGDHPKMVVPTLKGLDFIYLNELTYCEADGNYSILYFKNKSKKVITYSLTKIEKHLRRQSFCRIHRKYLINLRWIKQYVRGRGGYVVLENGIHLNVSVRRKEQFLKCIGWTELN